MLSGISWDSRRKITSIVESQYNVILSCKKKEQKFNLESKNTKELSEIGMFTLSLKKQAIQRYEERK